MKIEDREHLLNLLKKHKVPYETWGTGEAKSFEHLYREIFDGESMIEMRDGKVFRISTGSTLRVYYKSRREFLWLKEDKQVFNDGRVKRRELRGEKMSIGEKLKPGESPTSGAWRALAEELCIVEKLPLIPLPDIVVGPVESVSFPGLQTIHTIFAFEVYIPERWYRREGYIEKQSDKTNYYVWKIVP